MADEIQAIEAEFLELRRQIVVEKENPIEVAIKYENNLLEKNIKRFAHWEALRRLREMNESSAQEARMKDIAEKSLKAYEGARQAAWAAVFVAACSLIVAAIGVVKD